MVKVSHVPTHLMITRGKACIFKPNTSPSVASNFDLSIPLHLIEPTTACAALLVPEWKKATDSEFQTLMESNMDFCTSIYGY